MCPLRGKLETEIPATRLNPQPCAAPAIPSQRRGEPWATATPLDPVNGLGPTPCKARSCRMEGCTAPSSLLSPRLTALEKARLEKAEGLGGIGQAPMHCASIQRTATPSCRGPCRSGQWPGPRLLRGKWPAGDDPAGDASCLFTLVDERGLIQLFSLRRHPRRRAAEHPKASPSLTSLVDAVDLIGCNGSPAPHRQGRTVGKVKRWEDAPQGAAKPLPDKLAWAGRVDEALTRSAISDLIVSPQTRETSAARQARQLCIRAGSNEREFLEIETPCSCEAGGADGPAVTPHHKHLDLPAVSCEIPPSSLKRLVVGRLRAGLRTRRIFRQRGHQQPATTRFHLVEVYQAYADYTTLWRSTEALIAEALSSLRAARRSRNQGTW